LPSLAFAPITTAATGQSFVSFTITIVIQGITNLDLGTPIVLAGTPLAALTALEAKLAGADPLTAGPGQGHFVSGHFSIAIIIESIAHFCTGRCLALARTPVSLYTGLSAFLAGTYVAATIAGQALVGAAVAVIIQCVTSLCFSSDLSHAVTPGTGHTLPLAPLTNPRIGSTGFMLARHTGTVVVDHPVAVIIDPVAGFLGQFTAGVTGVPHAFVDDRVAIIVLIITCLGWDSTAFTA